MLFHARTLMTIMYLYKVFSAVRKHNAWFPVRAATLFDPTWHKNQIRKEKKSINTCFECYLLTSMKLACGCISSDPERVSERQTENMMDETVNWLTHIWQMNVSGEAEAQKPVWPEVLPKNKNFHVGMFDSNCLSSLASSLGGRSLSCVISGQTGL